LRLRIDSQQVSPVASVRNVMHSRVEGDLCSSIATLGEDDFGVEIPWRTEHILEHDHLGSILENQLDGGIKGPS
jgi:hypothetical protein